MSNQAPIDPRVAESFGLQQVMATFGATLTRAVAGEVEITMPFDPKLTQQHGFLHAGVVATVLDSACGYAAYTLMPAGSGVLSIEFKTNLLAPARGQSFRFVGRVIKPGRTITVAEGHAYAVHDGVEKLVSTMTCTLMVVQGRPEVVG